MHRIHRLVLILAVALILAPLAGTPAPVAMQTALAATTDDEIVLINSVGRIVVADPNVAAGTQRLNWESPDTGWTQVVLGDVNGDGDDEIVALRSGLVRVFDPVVPPGRTPATYQWDPMGGAQWLKVATGDLDRDGRAEVLLTHSLSGSFSERLIVYDGNATGTSFSPVSGRTDDYGAPLRQITTGDVNNDGYADYIFIRDSSNLMQIRSGQNWVVLFEQGFTWPWSYVRVANFTSSFNGDEIALTRNLFDPAGVRANYYVLWYTGTSNLGDVDGAYYYPSFTHIGAGDLNGDGDAEVLLLRDPVDPRASLIVRNPGGSSMRVVEIAMGRQWRRAEGGDTDADGRDEVVVLSSNEYRIYNQLEINDNYLPTGGSFLDSALALGNLDGQGIVVGPTLNVTPSELDFGVTGPTPPPAQTVNITNTGQGGSIAWTATVVTDTRWIRLNRTSGTTPGALSVSVDATGLSSGDYVAGIRIAGPAGTQGSPYYVTVNLSVSAAILGVSPSTMTFNVGSGGTASPQTLNITNNGAGGALPWNATASSTGWLQINPTSGTTPGSPSVSVNATSRASGTYVGTIQVSAAGALGSPKTVTVTMNIAAQALGVSPASLNFSAQRGGSNPAAQLVLVSNSGGGLPFNWSATVVTGTGWLNVTPGSGSTPATFNASVNIAGLTAGTYDGAIRVSATGIGNSPITVPVRLTITNPSMAVSPNKVFLDVREGQEDYSPPAISITQVGGGNAINWIAGAIPAGQWNAVAARLEQPGAELRYTDAGLVVGAEPDVISVSGFDWLILSPISGTVPSIMFVRVDQNHATPGLYRATIVIDGGPGTANRFQSVDLTIFIHRSRNYLPSVAKD